MSTQRLLVVDDEPHIVKLVSRRLAPLGFEILTAADGEEGLRRAEQEKPDLLLIDVMMPGLSGIDVCRKVKADPSLQSVRVVLFSAKVQDEDVQAGKRAGADAYVTKPFDPQNLIQTILDLLDGGQNPGR